MLIFRVKLFGVFLWILTVILLSEPVCSRDAGEIPRNRYNHHKCTVSICKIEKIGSFFLLFPLENISYTRGGAVPINFDNGRRFLRKSGQVHSLFGRSTSMVKRVMTEKWVFTPGENDILALETSPRGEVAVA